MDKKYCIAVIGCGRIASIAHLPTFASISDKVRVKYACDIIVEKAEEKKKDLKALLKYGQLPLLDLIIRKDSVFNALDVPNEVVEFIEKL